MKQLEPYEKPEIEYWPAQELDAIVATMSGGSGGGYAPADSSKPYNYKSTALGVGIGWSWASVSTVNQYWFVIDDSGVHDIEVNVSRPCELYVFSEGGTPRVDAFDGAAASGTKSLTVETTYLNRTFICVTPSAQTTIKVRAKRHIRTIAAASIGSGGVEWVPSNPMYRPDESPVCLFRWYIDQSVVGPLIEVFDKEAPKLLDLVLDNATEALAELLARYLNKTVAMALAYAGIVTDLVSVLTAISDLSEWVIAESMQNCACNSSGVVESGLLFILENNLNGDGATVQTPLCSFQRWNGSSATGASGYDNGVINTLS